MERGQLTVRPLQATLVDREVAALQGGSVARLLELGLLDGGQRASKQ